VCTVRGVHRVHRIVRDCCGQVRHIRGKIGKRYRYVCGWFGLKWTLIWPSLEWPGSVRGMRPGKGEMDVHGPAWDGCVQIGVGSAEIWLLWPCLVWV
jgi:hypothetical protein